MLSRSTIIVILVATVFCFSNTSCKKEQLLSGGGQVEFSVDTLTFDTVFTSYGSYTDWVKVFNPQNQKINISSVRLEEGKYFHLNINGIEGNSLSNIEVAANDSFYVFGTVNIDPNNQDNPFIIMDKLIVTLNGKEFTIPLIAYGQNAYYIDGNVDGHIKTETWKTDKPYVILHSGLVDSGHTLTIPAGCRIYMNADSRLYVQGTLKVEGTNDKPVVFQGGRLDRKYFGYEGYPGEWGGIYFFKYSHSNEISYAKLVNGGNTPGAGYPAAITLEPDLVTGDPAQLTLKNTIIENSLGYGILSFGGSLIAENCLVHTSGAQGLGIFQGGVYTINHCDFVTYTTDKVSHVKEPTVAILNYLDVGNNQFIAGDLTATITNSILYGSLEEEAFFDKVDGYGYDVTLENCLLRKKEEMPAYVKHTNCLFNQDPQFVSAELWDYHLLRSSPLVNAGKETPVTKDLQDKSRKVFGAPDIGCYEY